MSNKTHRRDIRRDVLGGTSYMRTHIPDDDAAGRDFSVIFFDQIFLISDEIILIGSHT